MKALGIKFRVDDLVSAERPFEGKLPSEALNESLDGLAGQLGYRSESDARVEGTVYLSAGGEVIVRGRLSVHVLFDCARCLTTRSKEVELDEEHVLVKRRLEQDGDRELIVSSDDEGAVEDTYEGDEVDLTDTFRQDLLLALPMNPSCEFAGVEQCLLDEGAAKAMEKPMDPRWAPLLALKKKLD